MRFNTVNNISFLIRQLLYIKKDHCLYVLAILIMVSDCELLSDLDDTKFWILF